MLGYNSREIYQDATYDIQTQEVGDTERSIETRVYRNGKVLSNILTEGPGDASISSLEEIMSQQHEEICGKVREGSYELTFLWISRGVISFESQDYIQALECFESVLTIEETHSEANAYMDKIEDCLEKSKECKQAVIQSYQKQIEKLERSGRQMEASRKKAIITRICHQPSPSPSLDIPTTAPNYHSRGKGRFLKNVIVSLASFILVFSSGLISTDSQIILDPSFHSWLGKKYFEKDKILSSRNIFFNILKQNPDSEEVLIEFWKTFQAKNDYQEAIWMLKELIQKEDSPALVQFYLAEAYREASLYQEATKHYKQALKLGMPEKACKMGLGLCLLDQKKPSAAIKLWQKLIKKGVKDFRIDYCLGIAYQEKGRYGRASIYFAKALKKEPESAKIYRALGNCFNKMHQKDKAKRLLEKADQLEADKGIIAKYPKNTGVAVHRANTSRLSVQKHFPFSLL